MARSRSSSVESTEAQRAEEELFVHPGEFRANVVRAAHDAGYGTGRARTMSESTRRSAHGHEESHEGHSQGHDHADHDHEEAGHNHEHAESGGAHDHGSMNMEGVFLHVLGDAVS